MLVVLYTRIVSCTDQVRFFSMTRFWYFRGSVLLVPRDRPFFSWAALLFDGSYLLVPVLIFSTGSYPRSCLVRLCFRFLIRAALVLHAVGLEINQISILISNQIKSTMVLCSSSRPVLLATGSSIPTASAVRYYTVIQPCFGCCGSLLSCQATRRCSCWVCVVEDRKIDTRHSLFSLFSC